MTDFPDDPHYYRKNLRVEESDPDANPSPSPEEVSGIEEDMRVEHEKLGRGTILRIEGTGEKRIAVIQFEDRGTKKLKLEYAPLDILENQ